MARYLLILFSFIISVAYANTAKAQEVSTVNVVVRTGGDDLRGNDDNAFVSVNYIVDQDRRGIVRRQLNRNSRRLRDFTTTDTRLRFEGDHAGVDISHLQVFTLEIQGFSGDFDGDNWNVDAIRVTATLMDGSEVVLINEFASPLLRFTEHNRSFRRSLRSR